MHQYHGAPIGLALGGHVHITHLQAFALGLKVEMLDGIGVLEALQLGAIGRAFSGGEGGDGSAQQQAGSAQ